MASPEVSLIVPVKGRIHLAKECIRSILDQSLENWEALFIDDGSSAADLAELHLTGRNEARLQVLSRKQLPSGANHCRNIGIAVSRAPLLIFLDSDDLLAPNCLRDRIAEMSRNPDLGYIVYPHHFFRDSPGDCSREWTISESDEHLDNYFAALPGTWQTAGPIWRAAAVRRIGGWDERLQRYQDWEFHVRALTFQIPYSISKSGPDFYYRIPTSRESITGSTRPAASLKAEEVALETGAVSLRAAGLMNARRKTILACRYTFIARGWVHLRQFDRAWNAWVNAYKNGFFPRHTFFIGVVRILAWRFSLLVGMVRGVKRFGRRLKLA